MISPLTWSVLSFLGFYELAYLGSASRVDTALNLRGYYLNYWFIYFEFRKFGSSPVG